ncbi:MAG TPA: SRPBCC family protein [Chloroflexota bacterium]|nr:SRPBCC family protein [Chloroflexota bacterium]
MTRQISKSIIVNTPASHAYTVWADVTQFPKFMGHIKSVTILGNGLSHWVIAGPMGTNIDWNAETTTQEPHSRIAWNTKDYKGSLTTSGQVTFNPLHHDQTEITVTMQYSSPGGKVGEWLAGFLAHPEESVAADLRRFKAYTEAQRQVSPAATTPS